MATYRKRNNKWQVRIQRRNNPPIAKTFVYKEDAKVWARQQEREIDLGIEVANQDITLKLYFCVTNKTSCRLKNILNLITIASTKFYLTPSGL